MSRFLLAAEADQIQDFIFKASHLREVVGGSQLLTRFGDDTQDDSAIRHLLTRYGAKAITAGGGSFRVLFADHKPERVQEFGQLMAEVYRRATGGTLTVAEPILWAEIERYEDASQQVEMQLQQAKRSRGHGGVTAQLPFVAFCVSCGVELAHHYVKHHWQEADENAQYLCHSCRKKGLERNHERERDHPGVFLHQFFEQVIDDPTQISNYFWPGKNPKIDPTTDLAQFDPRRYVAYLLADGNRMGRTFSNCSLEQADRLSHALTETLRHCVAEPVRNLMGHIKEEYPRLVKLIPALPLILGGDDLFILLPARWAFDVARQFCLTYEAKMMTVFKDLGLPLHPPPTVSATLVICKANYPFYLAHQAGQARLKEAKCVAGTLALAQEADFHSSILNFEIITGSQLVRQEEPPDIRDTLRPYWLKPPDRAEFGRSIDLLLESRKALEDLPNRRRAQLRGYFDQLVMTARLDPMDIETQLEKREADLQRILTRIKRNQRHYKDLAQVLESLGALTEEGLLQPVDRGSCDNLWRGHGLPDLLDAWDFTEQIEPAGRQIGKEG